MSQPTTDIARREAAPPPPPVLYRQRVESIAFQALDARMATEEGRAIASRFALAFATAARVAKDPDAYYRCDPGSLAAAVSMSIDTGLLPGGALPEVYLVPRGGEIQWTPTHRGLIKLAREAGYIIRAVPVGKNDVVTLEDGEVVRLEQDPDACPEGLDDLRGVVVYARTPAGERVASVWVSGGAIRKRSKAQGAGPVWKQWPVEMAIKSAIRYAFARGYIPMQSVQLDTAIAADGPGVVEAEAEPVQQPRALPVAEPPAALRTTPTPAQQGLGDLAPADPVDDPPPASPDDF